MFRKEIAYLAKPPIVPDTAWTVETNTFLHLCRLDLSAYFDGMGSLSIRALSMKNVIIDIAMTAKLVNGETSIS